jgi:membrane-associated protease RseP (regulator of RpoE activity)
MTVYANVTSVLRTLVVHARFMRIACLTALGVGLVLANSGFGDDNQKSDKPKASASSAGERPPDADQRNRENNFQFRGDENLRHHGALGVFLSKSEDGVTVVGVIPGSPAELAGLHLGDEIRYVDDRRIRTTEELTEEILESKPGTQVDLSIRRSGRRQIVTAILANHESVFGTRNLATNTGAGRSNVLADRGNLQTDRSQRTISISNGPKNGDAYDLQQLVLTLKRQVYQQQQQLNQLRNFKNGNFNNVGTRQPFDFDEWWQRQHRGEADNDPALFQ